MHWYRSLEFAIDRNLEYQPEWKEMRSAACSSQNISLDLLSICVFIKSLYERGIVLSEFHSIFFLSISRATMSGLVSSFSQ